MIVFSAHSIRNCFSEKPQKEKDSSLVRISLVFFEVLLVGVGCGLYFSGVGVIPASICWGAPLLMEIAAFACVKASKVVEKNSIQDPKLAFFASLQSLDIVDRSFFDLLVNWEILQFDTCGLGIVLKPGNFLSPDLETPAVSPPRLDEFKRYLPFEKNAFKSVETQSYNASRIATWLYLAAAPMDANESKNFWRMVKEVNSSLIVMVTDYFEDKIDDSLTKRPTKVCEKYFPDSQFKEFEDFVVSSAGNNKNDSVNGKSFNIVAKDKSFKIDHCHIHGSLYDAHVIKNYTSFCKEKLHTCKDKSIVVHDDEGRGRAAAFAICLILHVIHEAAKGAKVSAIVDLKLLIKQMRSDQSAIGRYGLLDDPRLYKTIEEFAELLG